MSEIIRFAPYARLLTMLGDQLIKNERVALVEIIKNSYDADASWARVVFENFDANYDLLPGASIVIEDDGEGMTREVLREHWVSPATPVKKLTKASDDTTSKGRKIQGEKGIGRFAILKLGRKVEIVTRPPKSKKEYLLTLDLSHYDDDLLEKDGVAKKILLSEIDIKFEERAAKTIIAGPIKLGNRQSQRADHGTRITVSDLRGEWDNSKVEAVYDDLTRLQSVFLTRAIESEDEKPKKDPNGFDVFIFRGKRYEAHSERYLTQLAALLKDNTVLRLDEGIYDEEKQRFTFDLNGRPTILPLSDPTIMGLRIFRDRFGKKGEKLTAKGTACGSFHFGFYIFDFSKDAKGKHHLDLEDKALIKKHRIYLYRDTIRVYPYGDPKDDWLEIDAYRGTISAGQFLSNDQVVGFVNITQVDNPNLRDKTSREGLIDTGAPTDDFLTLIKLLLAWIRQKPYAIYRQGLIEKSGLEAHKRERVSKVFEELDGLVEGNSEAKLALGRARKFYKQERDYLVQRAETTEQLAGVGMSVETASHDIMAVMSRAMGTLDSLLKQAIVGGELDWDEVERDLSALRGMLSFVESQLKNIQLLFKSSKQRRRDVRVADVLDKVQRLFQPTLEAEKISFEKIVKGSPLVVKTTDAVLLQLFLNLFDNAVYWLESQKNGREILVTMNGEDQSLIFSDSGPGIRSDDAPYIFEPFFSGKGEEGRGLGLYIARQLLERHDYLIELADSKSQRKLKGANFVVSFSKDAEND
jgi:signal transduction histidine kinase